MRFARCRRAPRRRVQHGSKQHYVDLLSQIAGSLFEAEGTGGWRTGVYLYGTSESFYARASVWRAIFAGTDSSLKPVQVFEMDGVAMCAGDWSLPNPDSGVRRGHGYEHRFSHQSLLTSAQLAWFRPPPIDGNWRVPDRHRTGLRRRPSGHVAEVAPIELGRVIEPRDLAHANQEVRASGARVAITPSLLTRHVFVTGLTGEGKTTTVKRLLVEASQRWHRVPRDRASEARVPRAST